MFYFRENNLTGNLTRRSNCNGFQLGKFYSPRKSRTTGRYYVVDRQEFALSLFPFLGVLPAAVSFLLQFFSSPRLIAAGKLRSLYYDLRIAHVAVSIRNFTICLPFRTP